MDIVQCAYDINSGAHYWKTSYFFEFIGNIKTKMKKTLLTHVEVLYFIPTKTQEVKLY